MPAEMAPAIAAEMASEIGNLVGAGAFRAIVPMPCSNAQNSTCLSREIARSLGNAAQPARSSWRSPRQRAKALHTRRKILRRAKMSVKDDVAGPVILVDDVATSGAHVEEAVHLLKPSLLRRAASRVDQRRQGLTCTEQSRVSRVDFFTGHTPFDRSLNYVEEIYTAGRFGRVGSRFAGAAAPAMAKTNFQLYLGVPYYDNRLGDDYRFYPGRGWYRPPFDRGRWGISCNEGRRIIRQNGYRNVRRH